jgi:RND family efflux transporter MFP subunit
VDRLEQAGHALPRMDVERVRNERDLARDEIRIAEVRIRQTANELERCTVPAPFAGVVTRQLRRAGADVARGELLATMTDPYTLEARASVPIRYLPQLQTGRIAEVRLNKTRFEGVVRTIVPAADATSQTFEVRIDLPAGASDFVAGGQLVSVLLPLSVDPALTVPRDAIVLRADGTYVILIDADNRARPVAVDVADASGDRVSISGDVRAGDRIAVRGAEAVAAGDAVQVLADT